jgi:hypothetical protein
MVKYSVWLEHFIKMDFVNPLESNWRTNYLSIQMNSIHKNFNRYENIFSLNKKFHDLKTICIWKYSSEFCTNDPRFSGNMGEEYNQDRPDDYWIFKKLEENSYNLTLFRAHEVTFKNDTITL